MDYILDDTESVLNFLHVIICADVEERLCFEKTLASVFSSKLLTVSWLTQNVRETKE